MRRGILILAIVLVALGVFGIVALNAWQSATPSLSAYGMMGPGMMNGGMTLAPHACAGVGGRGFGRYGANPRGYSYGTAPGIAPFTSDQAVTRAQTAVASYSNPDLTVAEVMEFSNNFYIRVKEKSSGTNAFELLVDRYRGTISPELGPNMMWNAKYSPMSQMMGNRFVPSAQNTVTAAQAKEKAQQYLDAYMNGAKVADDADAFYGYYTIDILRNGKTFGMLSVNGVSGTVWYHTWHGTFVSEKEIK